jgi:hypothetical protein
MYNRIKEYTMSQDFQQHVCMGVSVTIELYRVLVSTLLILFIPQDCGGGQMCSLLENMASSDNVYTTGISFNFITFGVFLILYAIEISREKKLIKYLEVNPQIPSDNESLTLIFDIIPIEYKNKIYRLDYYYQKTTYVCVLLFIVNTIISGIVIYHYSLGNQTTTTFITNVLFMATKVYDSYSIANTEKSIFYSAYMRNHVQFNDIDPSFKRRLSTIMIEMSQREYQEIEIDESECEREHEHEVEDVLSEIVNKIADIGTNTNTDTDTEIISKI